MKTIDRVFDIIKHGPIAPSDLFKKMDDVCDCVVRRDVLQLLSQGKVDLNWDRVLVATK